MRQTVDDDQNPTYLNDDRVWSIGVPVTDVAVMRGALTVEATVAGLVRSLIGSAMLLLAACQPFEATQVAAVAQAPDSVSAAPVAADPETERNKRCADLRKKMAETRSHRDNAPLFMTGKGFIAAVQLDADRKLAALESQYADLQCDVIRVVPGTPVIPPATSTPTPQMTFDDCFRKCRELTSRTDEACFDSCRR